MTVQYDDKLARYVRALMDSKGITSSRQAEMKTGVSFGSIQNMLHGKRVKVGLFVQFIKPFGVDVGEALRECGYTDMAYAVQGRPPEDSNVPVVEEKPPDNALTYEPLDHDEEEMVSFYRGMAPVMRPAAKAALKAMLDSMPDADEWSGFGKKTE
jgi:hypothetical protein